MYIAPQIKCKYISLKDTCNNIYFTTDMLQQYSLKNTWNNVYFTTNMVQMLFFGRHLHQCITYYILGRYASLWETSATMYISLQIQCNCVFLENTWNYVYFTKDMVQMHLLRKQL